MCVDAVSAEVQISVAAGSALLFFLIALVIAVSDAAHNVVAVSTAAHNFLGYKHYNFSRVGEGEKIF